MQIPENPTCKVLVECHGHGQRRTGSVSGLTIANGLKRSILCFVCFVFMSRVLF
jgi:hypothetical protein